MGLPRIRPAASGPDARLCHADDAPRPHRHAPHAEVESACRATRRRFGARRGRRSGGTRDDGNGRTRSFRRPRRRRDRRERTMKTRWITLSLAQLVLGALLAVPLSAAAQSTFEVVGSGTVETNCLATLVPSCTVTSNLLATGTPVPDGQLFLRFDTGAPASSNGYPGGPSILPNPGV